MQSAMQILLEPIISLLIISPLIFIGKKTDSFKWAYLLVFGAYFLLDTLVTALPVHFESLDFFNLKMNWQGKVNSYLLAIAFLFTYRKFPITEYGLTLKQKEGTTKYIFITIAVFIVFVLLYSHFVERYSSEFENILFQLTMPSIVEEIVFRGIILGLLNFAFVKSFKLGATKFGMGAIISSILFGLWHGLNIDANLDFSMYWVPLIYTSIVGFVLALVTERTGSILIPIVLHIIINLVPNLMGYLY